MEGFSSLTQGWWLGRQAAGAHVARVCEVGVDAGPSNATIPRFAAEHWAEPRCDVIYIDGGHTEREAAEDLLAFSLLARPGRTVVVMDDVGCEAVSCPGPTA